MRGGVLTIDLAAIQQNHQILNAVHKNGIVAAVVKANAYGLGFKPVVKQLVLGNHCKHFFVADIEEAIQLRLYLRQEFNKIEHSIRIFVLHGLFDAKAELFDTFHLTPILNSIDEIKNWIRYSVEKDTPFDYALHFDTGMSGLGLQIEAYTKAAIDLPFPPLMVMSHLSAGDEQHHPQNKTQLARFEKLIELFPYSMKSLSNSSGIFLGDQYHFDLSRPGRALYGIKPLFGKKNPVQPVVSLKGRVVQIKTLAKGTTISYGCTYITDEDKRIAVCSFGYADGIFRILSNNPLMQAWCPYYKNYALKILGRVCMDLIMIDISAVPESELGELTDIDFIGPHNGVDEMACAMHSIGYEVLTSFGPKSTKRYINELDHNEDTVKAYHKKNESL